MVRNLVAIVAEMLRVDEADVVRVNRPVTGIDAASRGGRNGRSKLT